MDSSKDRIGRTDALALGLLTLAVLSTRGIWFGDPVADYDEQLYSFIGGRLLEGELPFVDWWDRKPFGLFALYALAHALFGPGPLAYQVLAAGFAVVASWLTYALARKLVDRATACLAGVLVAVLLPLYSSHSGQSEVFFAPLLLAMLWLLAEPGHARFAARAVWAMLLGGLALQIKYTVLPACLFLGSWALWQGWRGGAGLAVLAKRAACYVLFGLLPTGLVAMLYASAGQFDGFAFANFTSFFDRLPAQQGRWSASHWIGTAPLAIPALGGIYAAFRICAPRDPQHYLLLLGWALASLAGVLLPGTVYLYYYAALAAPATLVALPLLDRRGPMRGVPGLLMLLACLALFNPSMRRAESLAEREAAATFAAAIAPHVGAARDCLWLWDGPVALYRLTDSCVPTRFVYPDHLNNALESPAIGLDQTGEVARVLATRPGAIITASRAVTVQNAAATALVQQALARDYREGPSVEMHGRTLTAWFRVSPPAPGRSATATAPPQR